MQDVHTHTQVLQDMCRHHPRGAAPDGFACLCTQLHVLAASAHLLGHEVCTLGGWSDALESWLLKQQQYIAMLALAWLWA